MDRIQTGLWTSHVGGPAGDELVAEAIKRLAESFAQERNRLESQWDRGDEVSTEDLRVALQTIDRFSSGCFRSNDGLWAGWNPARRLITALAGTAGGPIDNRLQLTKLPHI